MLPQQAAARPFLTDGGLETTLIFHRGIELREFAAFDLLRDERGTAALSDYFEPYLRLAREQNAGFVLDTATWRASPDWAERLGYSPEELEQALERSVQVARKIRSRHEAGGQPIVINGVVGPRGDGYVAGERMSADEAEQYHATAIGVFARAGADMVSAITMTYSEEATGIARAAAAAGVPAVISFTVETDGRLPSGQPLREAIEEVDAKTGGSPAYFMINCAHPLHFGPVLEEGGTWLERIGGLRANASKLSHAELDAAEELDTGDPVELGAGHRALGPLLPSMAVLGGCCGTDHRHVAEIARSWPVV
jgi:homocysteine S-methyltransferase